MRTCEANRSGSARYEATSQRGRLSCSSSAAKGRCQSRARPSGGVRSGSAASSSTVRMRSPANGSGSSARRRSERRERLTRHPAVPPSAVRVQNSSSSPSCTSRGTRPPTAPAWISLKVRCRVTKIDGCPADFSDLPAAWASSAGAVDCGWTLRATGVAPSLFATSSTRLRTLSSCLNRLTASCTAWAWSAWACADTGAAGTCIVDDSAADSRRSSTGIVTTALVAAAGAAFRATAGAACPAEGAAGATASDLDAAASSASRAVGVASASTAAPAGVFAAARSFASGAAAARWASTTAPVGPPSAAAPAVSRSPPVIAARISCRYATPTLRYTGVWTLPARNSSL